MDKPDWNLEKLKGEIPSDELNDFLQYGNFYKDYLREDTRGKLETAGEIINRESILGNPEADSFVEQIYKGQKAREDKVTRETSQMIRKLNNKNKSENRAGYIEATIILYVIFILGIFLSLGLLLIQK